MLVGVVLVHANWWSMAIILKRFIAWSQSKQSGFHTQYPGARTDKLACATFRCTFVCFCTSCWLVRVCLGQVPNTDWVKCFIWNQLGAMVVTVEVSGALRDKGRAVCLFVRLYPWIHGFCSILDGHGGGTNRHYNHSFLDMRNRASWNYVSPLVHLYPQVVRPGDSALLVTRICCRTPQSTALVPGIFRHMFTRLLATACSGSG